MLIKNQIGYLLSLPSRGAWIEMSTSWTLLPLTMVAPLAGSVDRNHKGAVPRLHPGPGAPLAGSVDRNCAICQLSSMVTTSLPSRGAWIEIKP